MYNMVSPEQSVLVALFMIFNRAIPMGAFSLFALPLSDIADQDMLINSRPHSMSSTIFGLNAFFTKPAQSIGPKAAQLVCLDSFPIPKREAGV